MIQAVEGIGKWFRFYNQDRPHQGLAYQTPAAVYAASRAMDKRQRRVASE